MAKILQKNKFELDRPDYENHANRADRYLIRLMAFLLNAKLWSGDHIPLMDYN